MKGYLRSGATVTAMLALYTVVPVPGQHAPVAATFVVATIGLGCLAWATLALARQARGATDRGAVRLETLVALLYVFLAFMSLVYLGLSSQPGEFVGLHDRVDALYFTLTTVATVGYGDVHAVGRAARSVVTAQIFFDLVFVALIARTIAPSVASGRRSSPTAGEASPSTVAHDHADSSLPDNTPETP